MNDLEGDIGDVSTSLSALQTTVDTEVKPAIAAVVTRVGTAESDIDRLDTAGKDSLTCGAATKGKKPG